jgi:hypothetical protein
MVTSPNPMTMQATLELAERLTDEMVRNGTSEKVQVGEKRKFDNRNFRNNNNSFKKNTSGEKLRYSCSTRSSFC